MAESSEGDAGPSVARKSMEDSDSDSEAPCEPSATAVLFDAVERGDADAVRRLLEDRASVDEANKLGFTPLHVAAQWGHLAVVKILLQHGAKDTDNDVLHAKQAPFQPAQRPLRGAEHRHQPTKFTAINIAPFVERRRYDETARWASATAWDEAFRRVGFAQIEGHGIRDELISEMLGAAKTFFAQPSEYKMKYFRGETMTGKSGFSPMGCGTKDPLEGFTFIRRRPEAWKANEDCPPELVGIAERYANEVERVMHAIQRMSATALGLDPNYFVPFYTTPASVLVISHYPAPEVSKAPCGKLRYRAHSDYSGFTILLQDQDDNVDGGGGLEVDVNGAWVPIVPQKGCFVVNIGDLFETWTNDRWRSTPHRVTSPQPGCAAASRSRYTVMLFSGPNLDSVIKPIHTCVDRDFPARYGPVLASDHLRNQYLTKSKESNYTSE